MGNSRIANLGTVITGSTPSSNNPELFGDVYPFITPTDIGSGRTVNTSRKLSEAGYKKFNTRMLPPLSVCFVCIGATIGKICMTSEYSLTNQQINSIVVDTSRHNPYYVYYLLSTFAEKVASIAGGAATPIVNKTNFENIKASMPSLFLQNKIATILSAYDDLIENNLRRIKTLEEMAQNLYREWFVNFRFLGYENARFVDSPLGEIPEGWRVENLFSIADVTYGYAFKSSLFNTDGLGKPVVRIRDVLSGVSKTFTTEEPNKKYLVENGDILVGMDGDFHMGFWVGGQAYLVQRVARFRAKKDIGTYLLFLSLIDPIKRFNSTITGTTVAHLGDKHLKTINILLPDKEFLSYCNSILESYLGLIISLKLKNGVLQKTRDLLLPKLISGELDVSNLDINLPEEVSA